MLFEQFLEQQTGLGSKSALELLRHSVLDLTEARLALLLVHIVVVSDVFVLGTNGLLCRIRRISRDRQELPRSELLELEWLLIAQH